MTLEILAGIILPIFALVTVGALVDRFFTVNLATLSRLNFYVFLPALVFVRGIESKLDPTLSLTVAGFTAIHLGVLLVVSWVLFGIGPFKPHRSILTLGALFYNAGNYGLPMAQLAFGDRGANVMALILAVQNIIGLTVGLRLVDAQQHGWKGWVRGLLGIPVVYAVAGALLVSALRVELPPAVRVPLGHLANGLTPVALLTLGVQLSRSRILGHVASISAVTAMRLLVSPLLAMGLAAVWSLVSPVAVSAILPILVAAAGLPVAVSAFILAVEHEREPELASQLVFWTTLLSALTLTAWLAIYR